MTGVALVLWLGPACPAPYHPVRDGMPVRHREAGDAPPLFVGLELELQAHRVVDAADEAHEGVGLLFHDRFFETNQCQETSLSVVLGNCRHSRRLEVVQLAKCAAFR
jgi:hypothetical protein